MDSLQLKRLLALLLVLAGIFAVSPAFAVDYSDRGSAYAGCMSAAQGAETARGGEYINPRCVLGSPATHYIAQLAHWSSGQYFSICQLSGHSYPCSHAWPAGQDCPAGGEWSDETHSCDAECPAGEVPDPEHPGQCLNSQKCLSRNTNIHGDGARPWGSKCISGCQIAVTPETATKTQHNGSAPIWRGRFEYNGNVCLGGVVQNPDPDGTRTDEKTKPQECVPTGPESRACVKPNGDTCYTTQAGRQTCWSPGETGTKTDGPVAQKRDPGLQDGAPNIQVPNGDTATKDGSTVQTTTTKPDGSTVNTSTTNYVTNSGANAGNNNDGEKDDGSGDGKELGDGDKGSASSNCETPPVCNQGDSIGCAMLRQSWLNHCQWAKDSGKTLEQVVGDTSELDAIPGLSTAMDKVHEDLDDFGPGNIDSSGFGARGNCPIVLHFNVFGRSWSVDHPQLCEILDALAALILLIGSIHATRILATGDLG